MTDSSGKTLHRKIRTHFLLRTKVASKTWFHFRHDMSLFCTFWPKLNNSSWVSAINLNSTVFGDFPANRYLYIVRYVNMSFQDRENNYTGFCAKPQTTTERAIYRTNLQGRWDEKSAELKIGQNRQNNTTKSKIPLSLLQNYHIPIFVYTHIYK